MYLSKPVEKVNLMAPKLYFNKPDLEGSGSEHHNSAETMSNCFTSKSQQTIEWMDGHPG